MAIDLQETVTISIRALAANKLRSGLTMLGIVIGNAAVITIVALGQGGQELIGREFRSLGTNLLFVTPGIDQRGPLQAARPAETLVLSDAVAIAEQVPAVSKVAPEKTERFRVTWRAAATQVSVTGATPLYPQVRDAHVDRGRFLSDLDEQQHQRVAVLGSDTANTLFGALDPLGQSIRIQSLSFQVVGVMASRGSSVGQNEDEVVFIPISVMANQLSGKETILNSPTVNRISVSARSEDQINAAQYQISNLLRLRHAVSGEDDFTVRSQQELLQTAENVSNILLILLISTAGISLMVGGIGIMNIMLVSVTERTHEIGLRKAIGATSKDILTQFTVEAVVLATFGGAIGVGLGLVGIVIMSSVSILPAVFSPLAIGIAVGVSGAIGLVFGVVPAQQAARLEPMIALRS